MCKRAIIFGAGGFIAGHLAKQLISENYSVTGVDIKGPHDWWQLEHYHKTYYRSDARNAWMYDLQTYDEVYNLACDMGGMGFIEVNRLETMRSVDINMKLLDACVAAKVPKYFYSSSACVYPAIAGPLEDATRGKQADHAWPANPDSPYGLEKLFNEIYCAEHAKLDSLTEIKVARFHNVYGPQGTWEGGREKAPAALCRKVAMVDLGLAQTIEVWGNGIAGRSFLHIDDCVRGVRELMDSDVDYPVNIGSERLVCINELLLIIAEIACVDLTGRVKFIDGPQGVPTRCSCNQWFEEQITLEAGLRQTYGWVRDQVYQAHMRSNS